MYYVIIRVEDGKFVSMPGSHNSYTKNLQKAVIYSDKERAENDCCGNEYVVSLGSILEGNI